MPEKKAFPLDPRASIKREKQYPNPPRHCQHGCFRQICQTYEYDFGCGPDDLTPRPQIMRRGIDR